MIDRVSTFFSNQTLSATQTPEVEAQGERVQKLTFHIETGDYFRYLSTILGFCEETLDGNPCTPELLRLERDAVRSVREELNYLHEHFRIEPR